MCCSYSPDPPSPRKTQKLNRVLPLQYLSHSTSSTPFSSSLFPLLIIYHIHISSKYFSFYSVSVLLWIISYHIIMNHYLSLCIITNHYVSLRIVMNRYESLWIISYRIISINHIIDMIISPLSPLPSPLISCVYSILCHLVMSSCHLMYSIFTERIRVYMDNIYMRNKNINNKLIIKNNNKTQTK